MAPRRHELTEQQWQRIAHLLPSDIGRPGRRPRPNRIMINAMLWVLKTGAPWRDLPKNYPKWKTVHTRFLRWSKQGVWKRVLDALAIDIDDELAMLDASIVRVHQDSVGGKKTAVSASVDPEEVQQPRYMLSWTVSATPRKSRSLVEQFFQKIKRCRRVATRYEKLAVTFLGMVLLACVLVWLA